jgi:FtsH-binding integral membrane protein
MNGDTPTMATSRDSLFDKGQGRLVGTGPLVAAIAGCTLVLTAVFVGIVALASGQAAGLVGRLPLYVLATAVAFLAVLLVADHDRTHGMTILGRSVAVAVVCFVTVSLGTEGVVYAVRYPETVVGSHLFVYLLSAAVIASGLGYWAARNRRDVSDLASSNYL